MKRILQGALLVGFICFFTFGGPTAAIAESSESACTREGLKSITDQFFTALEAHKPSSLPLASM